MKIEPYLFFDGQAEEALAFYEQALAAKVEGKMRYADCPEPVPPEYMPPGGPQKLLHASLLIEGRQRLMLSDGVPLDGSGFRGFALTLQYASQDQARRAFDQLGDGGRVVMPMGPTFFSPCYGQLFDRFGVQWMVMVVPESQTQA